jgi:hypothetical protein
MPRAGPERLAPVVVPRSHASHLPSPPQVIVNICSHRYVCNYEPYPGRGSAPYAYFGSGVDGDIDRVSLRTGKGTVISQGPGANSLGLELDDRAAWYTDSTDPVPTTPYTAVAVRRP